MTIDEMKAAGQRAAAIEAAQEELKKAKERLALLESSFKSNRWEIEQSWRPELILKKASDSDRYYHNAKDVTMRVHIPYGVVQQQLVNEVSAAQRKVIQLGGTA